MIFVRVYSRRSNDFGRIEDYFDVASVALGYIEFHIIANLRTWLANMLIIHQMSLITQACSRDFQRLDYTVCHARQIPPLILLDPDQSPLTIATTHVSHLSNHMESATNPP